MLFTSPAGHLLVFKSNLYWGIKSSLLKMPGTEGSWTFTVHSGLPSVQILLLTYPCSCLH